MMCNRSIKRCKSNLWINLWEYKLNNKTYWIIIFIMKRRLLYQHLVLIIIHKLIKKHFVIITHRHVKKKHLKIIEFKICILTHRLLKKQMGFTSWNWRSNWLNWMLWTIKSWVRLFFSWHSLIRLCNKLLCCIKFSKLSSIPLIIH